MRAYEYDVLFVPCMCMSVVVGVWVCACDF